MRPQHFPQHRGDGTSAQMYRFDMAWPVHGRIASCRVEMYAAGALGAESPLTVVIGDTPGSLPPTSAHIEALCALVWHFYLVDLGLQSLPARWIQRLPAGEYGMDQWAEITFGGKPGTFVDPRWSEARPIELLWDDVLAERCWVEEVRLINPHDISNADLYFTPDECYEQLTGVCSLDDPVPTALGSHQSSWRYCRQLARMAELWRLIVEYVGPERYVAELDVRALMVDRELYDYIEQNWQGNHGRVPEILPTAIEVAANWFGPKQRPSIAISGDVPYELTDGRHRSCVSRRLGIPICATVGVARRRKF